MDDSNNLPPYLREQVSFESTATHIHEHRLNAHRLKADTAYAQGGTGMSKRCFISSASNTAYFKCRLFPAENAP